MAVSSESLEMAIELERKGQRYYSEKAEQVGNPWSKKVLESLASRELDHIEVVKEIAEGVSIADVELPNVDIETEMKRVFDEFSSAEREDWTAQDTSIYDHALKLEEDLFELYDELAEQTEDPEERDFFEVLSEEEQDHYQSIQNAVYYLTDQKSWLSEEEGKVWGWMNV